MGCQTAMRQRTLEQLQVEKIARQLCTAAGEDPDRVLRFVAELYPAGQQELNVTRNVFMPGWKLRVREAMRLARDMTG